MTRAGIYVASFVAVLALFAVPAEAAGKKPFLDYKDTTYDCFCGGSYYFGTSFSQRYNGPRYYRSSFGFGSQGISASSQRYNGVNRTGTNTASEPQGYDPAAQRYNGLERSTSRDHERYDPEGYEERSQQYNGTKNRDRDRDRDRDRNRSRRSR